MAPIVMDKKHRYFMMNQDELIRQIWVLRSDALSVMEIAEALQLDQWLVTAIIERRFWGERHDDD